MAGVGGRPGRGRAVGRVGRCRGDPAWRSARRATPRRPGKADFGLPTPVRTLAPQTRTRQAPTVALPAVETIPCRIRQQPASGPGTPGHTGHADAPAGAAEQLTKA